MNRRVKAALCAVCAVCVCAPSLLAKQKPQPVAAPQGQRISVCSLLPKEEVGAHPGAAVHRALPGTAKKKGGLEPIAGVGDEAYFHNNRSRYAELYVRVGKDILTLQADVPNDGKIESVKPGVLSLAKAFVAKLR